MILDETFPPDPRVENEALTLINEGHEVFLFCLTYKNQNLSENINGIQVKRYKSSRYIYKLSALVFTISTYSKVMKKKIEHFIVENRIDVLHVHDIRIAEASFKAKKKYNLPIILDLHENRPEIMRFYPHLNKFPGKFIISLLKWKRKEEEFIKKANNVIVVTKEAKNEILNRINIDGAKVIDLPNTVRKDFFTMNENFIEIRKKYEQKFVLLYIGDTNLRRGLQTVIQSIKKLKETIHNVKLVIVGKNSTDKVLKNLVNNLEINTYVDFMGWQDPKYFASYILSSDICLSPLHRNLHHDTTYANKIFQYMSFEKPLLVSNATAQKNIVLNNKAGLVHKEKNVNDFCKKVIKLYNDKNLRVELGKNGRKFLEDDFLWEKKSKNLVDLYNSLSN